jgi:RNA-directed DNA polymerase
MSRLARLKAATSLSDVANLLDFKPKAVSYILYKQPADKKYRSFQIPKRSGGSRTIKAPLDSLKLLQRRLSDLLQDCMDEINAARQLKDRTAHGFKRKRSIISNARQHRHRRWVLNIDLEEYFPSINFGRVRGFFLKNRDFELNQDVATVLAQIACHDNSLPQGSPCSPVISNLVAHILDMRLVKLASEAGCTYSRYADDLTFSTNKRVFPPEIALPSATDGVGSHLWLPGEPLKALIEGTGFRINAQKTHLMYRTSRQNVTGLVVNQKINVRREYRHNVRAMVDRLVKTGQFEVMGGTQRDGHAVLEIRPGTLNELHGMLGFIDSIEYYNQTQASNSRAVAKSSREKVYREFLIYTTFYAADKPVIISEGETDNVYLTHAIRSLAADFPALAEVMHDGKIRLKVRLYKYRRSSTARLLDLKDGGSSVLATFIAAYKKETKAFTGPGRTEPVVILYDNDAGAKSIQNAIRNASRMMPTGSEPFVHVVKNLFAVATPLAAGKTSSKIEDFFDAATKATVIEGKSFNDGDGFDVERHYGKNVFAHRVVRPTAEAIDFSGFRPLLINLVAAINKHKSAIAHVPVAPP